MPEPSKRTVAVSYHTATDSDLASAIVDVLAAIDVSAVLLPFLSVSGYSIEAIQSRELRRDGWVNHYLDLLERSLGMVILRTRHSAKSEASAGRGMWIETRLAQHQAPSNPEFIFQLEYCSPEPPKPQLPPALQQLLDELRDLQASTGRRFDAASGRIDELESMIAAYRADHPPTPPPPPPPQLSPKQWAQDALPALQQWIDLRARADIPRPKRFDPDQVNVRGIFDPVEVGRSIGGFYWYLISVGDYYDCIWHCRRCFATSDVWIRAESRPPASCPNCGYSGLGWETSTSPDPSS